MIYITGATGHIGNNLVRLLIEKHRDFKILLRQFGPALENLDCELIYGDIFDPDFLKQYLRSGDTIVHMAGYIDLKNNQPQLSDLVNNVGTCKLIDFCQRNNIRLVYTSTVDCIPRSRNDVLIVEPDFIDPDILNSNYAISKAKATKYLLDKMKNKEIDAVILYPSSVIGINDFKPSAAAIEMLHSQRKKLLFYIRGGYNFIDVQDVSLAILAAIDKHVDGQYILAGYDKTLLEFYREIIRNSEKKTLMLPILPSIAKLFVAVIPRFSKMMIEAVLDNYHYDNSRMRQDLVDELTPFSQTVSEMLIWLDDRYVKNKTPFK
ncbi:MAG: NAD-dependent epimerase/dehydratase family protein [Bacilli bacterium]|nr:NAD-dependent epimerase/dehydratase family protein [Bacilli bacterium]MBN2695997.1 NAD-dependent epimerase/dehydratase family protein [Bacilli bacterium]